jgi:hypothetical protein
MPYLLLSFAEDVAVLKNLVKVSQAIVEHSLNEGSTQEEATYILAVLFHDHRPVFQQMIQSDELTKLYCLSVKTGGSIYGRDTN